MNRSNSKYQIISPEERQHLIDDYLKTNKKQKHFLCPWYLEGQCLFEKEVCLFAHGISDLVYYKCYDSNSKLYDNKQLPNSINLHEERNYKDFYQFQDELIKEGQMEESKKLSKEQLNLESQKKIRQILRDQMMFKMMKDFMELLINTYPDIFLTIKFVQQEFQKIGLTEYAYKRLVSSKNYYTIDFAIPPFLKKKVRIILKMPNQENFCKIMTEEVTNILNHYQNTGNQLEFPLNLGTFQKIYSISPVRNILLPHINVFCSIQKQKIETFINYLETHNGFRQNFPQLLQNSDLKLIKTLSMERIEFVTELKQNFHEFWQDNRVIAKRSKMIEHYVRECKLGQSYYKEEFNSFLERYLIDHRVYSFIFFKNNDFVINFKKLEAFQNFTDLQIFYQKKNQVLQKKPSLTIIQYTISDWEKLQEEYVEISDAELDKFESQTIILVDNPHAYEYARIILLDPRIKYIGIDSEGELSRGGHIDILQLGIIKSQVQKTRQQFLFDFHMMKNQDQRLFENAVLLIKYICENPNIEKIFHDCRSDSIALHLLFKIHPQNVIDMSAIYSFSQQLSIYKEHYYKNSQIDAEAYSNLLKQIKNLKSPGLNDVLNKYNALNGINEDKKYFHEIFTTNPNYNLERPMTEKFQKYCASDVEDLVQVYLIARQVLMQQLERLSNINGSLIVDYLIQKISKYFLKEGCIQNHI